MNNCKLSKEFKLSKKQNNTETEVEEVTEELVKEQLEQVEDSQVQQAHPRDVLLQVFEQEIIRKLGSIPIKNSMYHGTPASRKSC